jgi:hypothetical protein
MLRNANMNDNLKNISFISVYSTPSRGRPCRREVRGERSYKVQVSRLRYARSNSHLIKNVTNNENLVSTILQKMEVS